MRAIDINTNTSSITHVQIEPFVPPTSSTPSRETTYYKHLYNYAELLHHLQLRSSLTINARIFSQVYEKDVVRNKIYSHTNNQAGDIIAINSVGIRSKFTDCELKESPMIK